MHHCVCAPTPSGSLSQWTLWSGEARGPSHAQKRARSLLQTDHPRSAGDEHGCWGLYAVREGNGSKSMFDPVGTHLDPTHGIVSEDFCPVSVIYFRSFHQLLTSEWTSHQFTKRDQQTRLPGTSAAVINSSLCCWDLWSRLSKPNVRLKTAPAEGGVELSKVKWKINISASVLSTITILETSSRRRSTGAGRWIRWRALLRWCCVCSRWSSSLKVTRRLTSDGSDASAVVFSSAVHPA